MSVNEVRLPIGRYTIDKISLHATKWSRSLIDIRPAISRVDTIPGDTVQFPAGAIRIETDSPELINYKESITTCRFCGSAHWDTTNRCSSCGGHKFDLRVSKVCRNL